MLAPRQRAALVLRYYEDLTEAQTADAMGCSVGTVKSQTSRGAEQLASFLRDVPEVREAALVPALPGAWSLEG